MRGENKSKNHVTLGQTSSSKIAKAGKGLKFDLPKPHYVQTT